ncbi:MAG: transcription initiation factor IIB family protein [Halobacteriales archaeon]
MSHSSHTRTCPECEGQLRADGGETICSTCGLVVAEDQLDRGPEWRSFEADTRERTGAPLTRSRHDRGLSTVIGRGSDQLSGRKRRQLARLRRHHNRAKIGSKAERNQVYAFTEIRRITGSLSLPDSTRDRACVFFERAQEQDLLRGRSVEGFAAAALYAACRVSGLSRTMRELAAVARASPSELQVAYDAMNRDLGLPTGPIDPGEYIPRFASELDVPAIIEQRAQEYATEVREEGIGTGRHPAGVAAACLYAAAKAQCYPLTQDEAADVADVTPVTLRSTYVDLQD